MGLSLAWEAGNDSAMMPMSQPSLSLIAMICLTRLGETASTRQDQPEPVTPSGAEGTFVVLHIIHIICPGAAPTLATTVPRVPSVEATKMPNALPDWVTILGKGCSLPPVKPKKRLDEGTSFLGTYLTDIGLPVAHFGSGQR